MTKRIKVTIDRTFWARGNRARGLMIHPRGGKCCLQFLAEACGVNPEPKREPWAGNVLPHDFAQADYDRMPPALFTPAPYEERDMDGSIVTREWEDAFAMLNDHKGLDEPTREAAIALGFDIVLGVDVEFVGGDSC